MKIILKKKGLVLAVLLLTIVGAAAAQQPSSKNTAPVNEIVFSNKTWKMLAMEAQKKGQYIFVDAYATWCGPCKLLKSTTFKDKTTAAYFNKNFINYTIDMEKGEGLALAEKWDITVYPTLLFFSPEGKMIGKHMGYVDGQKLLELGKLALKN